MFETLHSTTSNYIVKWVWMRRPPACGPGIAWSTRAPCTGACAPAALAHYVTTARRQIILILLTALRVTSSLQHYKLSQGAIFNDYITRIVVDDDCGSSASLSCDSPSHMGLPTTYQHWKVCQSTRLLSIVNLPSWMAVDCTINNINYMIHISVSLPVTLRIKLPYHTQWRHPV